MARDLQCSNGCGQPANLIITNTGNGDTVYLDFGCFPEWATNLMQQLLQEAELQASLEAPEVQGAAGETEPAETPAPTFSPEPEEATPPGGEDDRPPAAAEPDPALDTGGDPGLEPGPGPGGESD